MAKIYRCMGCGKENPQLIIRDNYDEMDGINLLVCKECNNNAFEFYK